MVLEIEGRNAKWIAMSLISEKVPFCSEQNLALSLFMVEL
jgi:hypothetical protein